MSARERRALRARRELAVAAVRLFEERGFNDTTVEDIAEEADYSASTFFRHFPAKEDAVFYDIADRMTDYEALLETSESDDVWQRVRSVLLATAAYWEDHDPEFALARSKLFSVEPVLYRRYLGYCDDVERLLTDVLAKHVGTTPAADVWCEVVAASAVGAWRAGITAWLATGERFDDRLRAGLDIIDPIARARPKKAAKPKAKRKAPSR